MNGYLKKFSLFLSLIPLVLVHADMIQETMEFDYEELDESTSFIESNSVLADDMSQNKQQRSDQTMQNTLEGPSCVPDIQPYQVNVRHIESKGIGYKDGYTTLQGFFAPSIGAYIPFVDLRGHVFNNGKFATNIGIGTRYLIDTNKYMVGANFFYDYRNTKHYHYNQIGAGVEAFIDRWEFHANGYLPVGNKTHVYDSTLQGASFKGFQGHYLLINEQYKQKREFAMKGFNAEVGVHPLAIMRNYDLYVGAGTYYFHGASHKNAWGGKLRVKAEVMKYLFLEISDSYDQVFHNRFQGEISISYPLGGKKSRSTKSKPSTPSSCFADNVMCWRGSQPVDRQEIIVVDKYKRNYTKDPIAINPATNQPYYFEFVNNTNPRLGDGTFENPFSNLSTGDNTVNAQDASIAGNIIYVFEGTGTALNMSHGITLKNSQRLLGSGISNGFATTKGNVIVPPLTGASPSINNIAAAPSTVALANTNEVSGFNIFAGTGMLAMGAGPSGLTIITRNFISGNVDATTSGVVGTPALNLLFDSNEFNALTGGMNTAGLNSITITNSAHYGGGIFFQNGGFATTNLLISGNELHGDPGNGIELQPNAGTMTARITNNFIHNNVDSGIDVTPLMGGPIFLEIANNTFDNNANAVLIDSAVGLVCLRLVNNIGANSFVLTQSAAGILQLEPPDNNVGNIVQTGTITLVPPCSCNVCP